MIRTAEQLCAFPFICRIIFLSIDTVKLRSLAVFFCFTELELSYARRIYLSG